MSAKVLAQYHDPENPASFGGVSRFAKSQGISVKKAKQILEKDLGYTLHKQRRRHFPTLPVKVFNVEEQWSSDLVEVVNISKQNRGFKYLLTVVDVFSKYAWVEPLRLFKKGYLPGRTEEVFVIRESIPGPVPTYKVEEWDGTPLEGTFYEHDVQKVSVKDDDIFRIEKIVQRKGNKMLVHCNGWPHKYNSWIEKGQIAK